MSSFIPTSTALTPATGMANRPTTTDAAAGIRLPDHGTLSYAAKLAMIEDKPIMMDYWAGSIDKSVLIGHKNDDSKEKILVRNEEEYTSPISKIFKFSNEFIIMTENSIYIVDSKIPSRRISA